MKNFDIENLKRHNIYSAPDGFFDDVQKNVMDGIKAASAPEKKGRIIRLNLNYAAAACLLFICGLVAFFHFDGTVSTEPEPKMVNAAPERILPDTAASANIAVKNEIKKEAENTTAQIAASEPAKEKKSTAVVKTSHKKTAPVSAASKKAQFEQVMAELSNTELADMGKGAEQDIYLDLYY